MYFQTPKAMAAALTHEQSARPARRRWPAPLLACAATLGVFLRACPARGPARRVCCALCARFSEPPNSSSPPATHTWRANAKHGWFAAAAALCFAGTERFDRSRTVLAGSGGPVAAAAKAFHAQGGPAHAQGGAAQKGAYRCFVVDGKAQCVEAATNSLAKRKIIEIGKKKVPTTVITPMRLDEIKADIAANKQAADQLLGDEGWAGVERSQKDMAALIAAKIRGLSRMVGTLRESHEGIVQELIAKAAAPGPPVRVCTRARTALRCETCAHACSHACPCACVHALVRACVRASERARKYAELRMRELAVDPTQTHAAVSSMRPAVLLFSILC